MKLLAIDTSTDVAVLGLEVDGELLDGSMRSGRSHSRELLGAIEGLVAKAGIGLGDLDAIVYGKGPGSFTGLRIGVGVVQGLAYGLQLPVAPVSSMACRAQGFAAGQLGAIAVALQARLSEVYFGTYRVEKGIAITNQDEQVVEAGEVPACTAGDWLGVGDGWVHREQLEQAMGASMTKVVLEGDLAAKDLVVQGKHIIASGKTVSAMEALPEYLREEVATKPAQR